jgi:hypothetical protein
MIAKYVRTIGELTEKALREHALNRGARRLRFETKLYLKQERGIYPASVVGRETHSDGLLVGTMQFICSGSAAASAASSARPRAEHSGSHQHQMLRTFHASQSAARARLIAPEAGALPIPTAWPGTFWLLPEAV